MTGGIHRDEIIYKDRKFSDSPLDHTPRVLHNLTRNGRHLILSYSTGIAYYSGAFALVADSQPKILARERFSALDEAKTPNKIYRSD